MSAQAKKFKTVDDVEYKKCPECPKRERDQWHPVSEYGVRKNSTTRYSARCKTCVNEDVTRVRRADLKNVARQAVFQKVEQASHTHKHCPSCKKQGRDPWRLHEEFYSNVSKKDGLSSNCKNCDLEAKSDAVAQRRASRAPSPVKTTKYCGDCGAERPFTEFGRRLDRKGGFKPYCKMHTNLRQKDYYHDNPEFAEKNRKASAQWVQDNRPRKRDSQAKYQRERRASDLQFKISCGLRDRQSQAIKAQLNRTGKPGKKAGSAVFDLGCSIEYLISFIETKFYDGTTWENWGQLWQLDHIIPLHLFDLTEQEQFLKAVHYTNLQPLTIPDHLKKTALEARQRSQ